MTGNLRNGGKSEMVDTMTKQPGQINLSFSHTHRVIKMTCREITRTRLLFVIAR